MKAFLFWYQNGANSACEYVYIIAYTEKQAKYFWFNLVKKNGYDRMSDYAKYSVCELDTFYFTRTHKVGEALGYLGL